MQLISVQSKDKQPINYLDVLKLSKEKGLNIVTLNPVIMNLWGFRQIANMI